MTGPFQKEVYIRLTDDGTGFFYTVKYGWLRFPSRRVCPLEESDIPLGIEAPVPADRDAIRVPAHQALKIERHLGATPKE